MITKAQAAQFLAEQPAPGAPTYGPVATGLERQQARTIIELYERIADLLKTHQIYNEDVHSIFDIRDGRH